MNARLPLVGLLAIQILIGYEWFMSGLAKVVRGGFPSGLADELTEKSEGVGGWYRDFLDNVVIPNATGFGYLIELSELLVGVGLIAAALTWLFAWDRIGAGGRTTVLAATALAAVGGILMNVAFHMANGSAHPPPSETRVGTTRFARSSPNRSDGPISLIVSRWKSVNK